MIQEWHDKEAEKIWNLQFSPKLPQDIQGIIKRKLVRIHAATSINELRKPKSNHLEILHGKREGQYSIRVNDKYRICFYWNNGNVIIDKIINYH